MGVHPRALKVESSRLIVGMDSERLLQGTDRVEPLPPEVVILGYGVQIEEPLQIGSARPFAKLDQLLNSDGLCFSLHDDPVQIATEDLLADEFVRSLTDHAVRSVLLVRSLKP